jgi:hypothetical protein
MVDAKFEEISCDVEGCQCVSIPDIGGVQVAPINSIFLESQR